MSPWALVDQCNTVDVNGNMGIETSQSEARLDGDAAVGLWITIPTNTLGPINLLFLTAHVSGTYGLHINDGVNWVQGLSANTGGTLEIEVVDVTPGDPNAGVTVGSNLETVFSSSTFGPEQSQNTNSAAFTATPYETVVVKPGHTYQVVVWAQVTNNDNNVTLGDNGFIWKDESSMNLTVASIGWEFCSSGCPDSWQSCSCGLQLPGN